MAGLPGLPTFTLFRPTPGLTTITFGGGGRVRFGNFAFTALTSGNAPGGGTWTTAESIVFAVLDALLAGQSGEQLGLENFPTPESDFIASQLEAAGQPVPEQLSNVSPAPEPAPEPLASTPAPQQSPYVPSRPGQMPIGYNPNEPFVFGSAQDPGGIIDPRYAFPTVRDILEALRGELQPCKRRNPDGTCAEWDTGLLSKVLQFWIGQALAKWQRAIQEDLISEAQRRALIERQLALQNFWAQFRLLPKDHLTESGIRDIAAQFGLDTSLPKPAAPECCCKVGACKCRTDSH